MRNGTLDLWIPCSVALSLSHRDSTVSEVYHHVVASMGQRKNSESPRGIEQTKKTHFDLFNPNFIFNYHINMCNVFCS